jgi:hypothetical protein
MSGLGYSGVNHMNTDPTKLLKNLSNTDFWNPLDTDAMTERDWVGLRHPIVLNAKNLQVRIIRIFKDRSTNFWKMSAQADQLPDTNLAFKLEDNSLYQYILICGKKTKIGPVYELPVLKAYKSTYFRQNRRFPVSGYGWHISDLILPAEEVNVEKRKSSIAVILETYAKISPLDIKNVHFGFFQQNESPLLKSIKTSGKGFAMLDSRREGIETSRTIEFFSRKYTFMSLREAVPEITARAEIIARYKTSGISSEAIFPISVQRIDGTANSIAYISCHFRNRGDNITDQLLQTLVSIAEAVAVSVRNSNFERYPAKEIAVDASLCGIKVQIRNPQVRKALSNVSLFDATLFTGSDSPPLNVKLQKMQQLTLEDLEYIGCRIAQISKKSPIDQKTESKEAGMKVYREALSGLKAT